MRLLADENVPASRVRVLRERGGDILYVAELEPGITDEEVLNLSVAGRRPILTEDRGFGELVFRLKHKAAGVVLLRLPAGVVASGQGSPISWIAMQTGFAEPTW